MKRIGLALILASMAASAMAVELERVDLAALGKMELPAVAVGEIKAGRAGYAYSSGLYLGTILIIDGKEVLVDTELPKGLKCGKGNGIEIVCSGGVVRRVAVESPAAHLDRSFITVKGSTLEDILRNYGKPEQVACKDDRFVLKYPRQGLEFEVDKDREITRKITIYVPAADIPAQYPGDFMKRSD